MNNRLTIACTFALAATSMANAQSNDVTSDTQRGEPVTPFEFNGDLRDLPVAAQWQPGDPITEAAKRQYYPLDAKNPAAPSDWITAPDLLSDNQQLFEVTQGLRDNTDQARGSSRVTINNGNAGVSPGDPVIEVSNNYVMYGVNGNSSIGTNFTIYDKTGVKLAGPTSFRSLAPAGDPCATSVSDPIIHFDRLANRWFLLEMGGANNRLCTYVSNTENPVSGGWKFYGYATPSTPDYPKCTVWPNAYVCAVNESGAGAKVYAFDRANMLAGITARPAQRFTTVAKLAGYGFQTLLPATFMGSAANPPPAGAPIILARHNDDEAHAGTSANTTTDFLDLYALNLNWITPASSNITTLPRVNITEFNSWLRNYSDFASVPQPGSTALLDPIREVLMNSVTYRNLGTYQSIVGTFVTNQNAARTGTVVDAGLRWFELQNTGSGWSLRQEGTYSPADGATHHLIGAVATDKQGNIGFGFNVTKTSAPVIYPSLAYSGRLASDPLGIMTQAETIVAAGAAAETSGRWGDYYQMTVDPADDCTFWFVGMFRPAGSWQTRAQNFKFSSCGGVAPPTTYTVSGAVTTSAGAGVSGVTVSSGASSGSSDTAGSYAIAGLANASYTLTPSKSGCTFSPTSRAVAVASANVTGQAFTANCTTVTPTERLLNGNFDSITVSTNSAPDTSWSRTAFTGTSHNTLAAEAGALSSTTSAKLGVSNSATHSVSSKATLIPATATTSTLSFSTQITTAESATGTTAYDKLIVELVDSSTNAVLSTLVTLSNVNRTTTYVARSYNVNAYKGKNVVVRLRSTTDSSLVTTFRVDNVSLISD